MCRQACAEAAQKCQIRSMSISCGDISLVFLVGWRCLAPRPGACVHIWDALWQLLSQSNSALHLDLHLNFSTYRIFFVTIFTVAFCPHVPLEIPVLFYLLSFSYYWKHEVFRHFVAFRVGDTNLLVCQYFVRRNGGFRRVWFLQLIGTSWE